MLPKETDYNDFADSWIALNHMVKQIHLHTLQKEWLKAYDCALTCKLLSENLADFFDGQVDD
jgi:hypothetical protein